MLNRINEAIKKGAAQIADAVNAALCGEDRFPDIDDFRTMVGEILDEFPEGFFRELSGGVIVKAGERIAPEALANDLVTLGEYRVSHLGRQIVIYYGSFARLYGHLGGDELKARVRDTVRHEFRHHWEFLSGMHGRDSLEAEDRAAMRKYLERHRRDL